MQRPQLRILAAVVLCSLASVSVLVGEDFRASDNRAGFVWPKPLSAAQANPWLSLREQLNLPAAYTGDAAGRAALETGQARPLALASADFDEDGVPDLVCGYAGPGGGIVAVHRGNEDSIFPNHPGARLRREAAFGSTPKALAAAADYRPVPFHSPATVLDLPAAPDFLDAGDFDGDSHWDIVSASRGGKELTLLAGDGKGGFGQPRAIALSGAVTALVTGEINRRDGLADVIVGVAAADGPKLLVFEGPNGALAAAPEIIPMPAVAEGLALGRLDDDYLPDLAVAAGRQVVIIHGRDRKLLLDESIRKSVPSAQLSKHPVSQRALSIAVGDFAGGPELEIALLAEDGSVLLLERRPASTESRESTQPVATQAAGSPTSLAGVRVSGLPKDDLLLVDGDQLHLLLGERAAGARSSVAFSTGSRTAAVLPMRLNADALSDLVILREGDSAPAVAATAAAATYIVNSTADDDDGEIGDGVCDTGNGTIGFTGICTLRAATQEANTNPGADAIHFNIPGAGPHTINAVYPPYGGWEITDPVTIDGTTQPGYSGSPLIELDGSLVPGVSTGLGISAGNTTVRGLAVNRFGWAIWVLSAGGNLLEGDYFGVGVDGATLHGDSVRIESPDNSIGGTTAAARNLMCFVLLSSPTNVRGNFIGVDSTGNTSLGGACGVLDWGAVGSTIGGTEPGSGNVVSGATAGGYAGIYVGNGSLVQGNLVGTNSAGTASVGNALGGVWVTGNGNTIGGSTAGARNIISGNGASGVALGVAVDNLVQGNYIGTDVSGTIALGNLENGVYDNGDQNHVGGSSPGAGNVISGNQKNGILIVNQLSIENRTVQGNRIGTAATTNTPLGNLEDGIHILATSNVTVGGSGSGNTIAFNGGNGVTVTFVPGPISYYYSFFDRITANSIFSNGALGIDLGDDGVTTNDAGDPDVGDNNLQNYPVLTSAASSPSATAIAGTLNSAPSSTFTIEFFANTACDASGFGEGETYLGSTSVNTDANGDAAFNVNLPAGGLADMFITATATSATNDTSEFSQCVQAAELRPPSAVSVTPDAGVGASQVFRYLYSDGDGFANITAVQILINSTQSSVNACHVLYNRVANTLHLRNNANTGWLGPATPGVAGTLQNNQCVLDAGTSSRSGAGLELRVNLALAFRAAFGGARNNYMFAQDVSGLTSGWQLRGTWTVNHPPQAVSVTPSSGTGSAQTFSYLFSDPNGFADLSAGEMLINATLTYTGACYMYYSRPYNMLWLLNDTSTAWLGPVVPGTPGAVVNSQCTVNAGGSSASATGNNLTVNVAVSFTPAFAGAKKNYMQARQNSGPAVTSGWKQRGVWTVP